MTSQTMTGKIIKIHSDFIYVKSENKIIECKIRERLKKEKVSVFVGDNVLIEEVNSSSNQGVVTQILERGNFMPRPSVANIDQVIIVTSLAEPGIDFMQLNRYLCLAKLNKIPAIICVNKLDLSDKKDNLPKEIKCIYESLGYNVIFTCAIDGSGLETLKKYLSKKVSILSGMSGVGKSSLLNKLCPGLNLKTKQVSSKSGQGTHTTRHTELIEIKLSKENDFCQIADTPGFSNLKFDNIMPSEIIKLFDDIKQFAGECYYSDCLHLGEDKCNVVKNLDKIHESRYLSYKKFVLEANEYKQQVKTSGQKEESTTKIIDNVGKKKTKLIKISAQKKEDSRKRTKQKIKNILIPEEVYYNDEGVDL